MNARHSICGILAVASLAATNELFADTAISGKAGVAHDKTQEFHMAGGTSDSAFPVEFPAANAEVLAKEVTSEPFKALVRKTLRTTTGDLQTWSAEVTFLEKGFNVACNLSAANPGIADKAFQIIVQYLNLRLKGKTKAQAYAELFKAAE